jgi:hypothetical protein
LVELSKGTVPVGLLGMSPPGELTVTVTATATVCPFTEGLEDVPIAVVVSAGFTVSVTCDEFDDVKFASPEYTAWISTPEEVSANAVEHVAPPVWVLASQLRCSVAQPEMSFQVPPSLLEYWKSTEPEGPAGLSEPGAVTSTPALRATACPDTEVPGAAATEVVVPAWWTVSVALGEVERLKLASPEYTAWISGGEEPASKLVAHAEVPVWLSEFQLRTWAVQLATLLQLSPSSVEYRKSTVPVGTAGLSEPGAVINKVAVAVTA